ncbi:DUF3483 domain-containing protein [Derxia gummosa]|uniref:DUF3483 domain-containing protein n=1 Tax=Derxia gummosa DSM 723 TaxID=1121388 RepID=A0A8B6X227_9BURK|nr:DUF3483 domain-containing protein [Derxia gummosa]
MSLALAVTAAFWGLVVVVAAGVMKRAALWRAGATAPVNLALLATIPKRYFVDLHDVVAREPEMARTHVFVAGGAIGAFGVIALNYGLMLYWPLLDWALLALAALMTVGAVRAVKRRMNAPARLSRGAWQRFPQLLLLTGAGLLVAGAALLLSQGVGGEAQAAEGASAAAPVAGGFALLLILPMLAGALPLALGIGSGGPLKHAFAGLLHLAFHPRQARFDKRAAQGERTALAPLDLPAKEYGVEKPVQFAWNRLLSFDACVQCGKCEAACPAFAAGQPLNPKKLIQDLVVGMAGGTDAAYAGSPSPGLKVGAHEGSPDAPVVGKLVEPQTIWSCTTCRACVQECPMLIEHVDSIVSLRRHRALVEGDIPGKAPETLDNLRETATQGGHDNAARANWAIDLGVKLAEPGVKTDVLVIAGEGAFDMRYQRTLRAFIRTLKAAGIDFALMGPRERDCGDTARRLGDEATFERLARENIAAISALSFARIVTPDPHVFHSLANEYPALGGRWEVLHHTTFVEQLVAGGRLKVGQSAEQREVTYHDPCYLGRYNAGYEAPRKLLKTIGIAVVEMERAGPRSRCCGGGGGAPLTDIPGERRIPDMRMDDARATGAGLVAVACPQCTAMLEGVTGNRPDVVDVVELVAATLEVK